MGERGFLTHVLAGDRTESPFSEAMELETLLLVERAWLAACVHLGSAPAEALHSFDHEVTAERLHLSALHGATARDGVVVPELVAQLRDSVATEYGPYIHRGATSQDIADTTRILQLRRWLEATVGQLGSIPHALTQCRERSPDSPTMAYTRMQPAVPISWAARFDTWYRSVREAEARLQAAAPIIGVVQVGGPVGDRRGDLDRLAPLFAEQLDLTDPGASWHTDRWPIVHLAQAALGVTTVLAKIAHDICLLALTSDVEVHGAGRSSSMPHKRNPVQAELVIALTRQAHAHATLVMQGAVHPLERCGAAWASERWAAEELCLVTTRAVRLTRVAIDGLAWASDR